MNNKVQVIGKQKPNLELIAVLETWLSWAKAGDIHSLLILGEASEAVTRKNCVGDYDFPWALYALEMLKQDVLDLARSPEQQMPIDED